MQGGSPNSGMRKPNRKGKRPYSSARQLPVRSALKKRSESYSVVCIQYSTVSILFQDFFIKKRDFF